MHVSFLYPGVSGVELSFFARGFFRESNLHVNSHDLAWRNEDFALGSIPDVRLPQEQFVTAGRDKGDPKPSARVADSELRMVKDVNPAAHPGMNVTAEPNWTLLGISGKTMRVRAVNTREYVEFVRRVQR